MAEGENFGSRFSVQCPFVIFEETLQGRERAKAKHVAGQGMSGRILMHVQAPGRDDDEKSVKLSWPRACFWGFPGSSESCYQNYRKKTLNRNI